MHACNVTNLHVHACHDMVVNVQHHTAHAYIDTEVWCTCHVKSSIYMSTYAETYMLLHAYACVLHVQSSHSHIHDIGVVTCMHRGFKYMHGAGRCRRGSSVPQSSPS